MYLWQEMESMFINLAGLLIKDQTELYKAWNFLFKCALALDERKCSFVRLVILIKNVFKECMKLGANQCQILLQHLFADWLI